MPTENPRPAFDEKAALEALERLQDEIRQARSRLEQKVDEFDAWVRSTRAASQAERQAALDRAAPQPPAGAARAADRAVEPSFVSQPVGPAPATAASAQSAAQTAGGAHDADPWRSFEQEYLPSSAEVAPPSYFNTRRLGYVASVAALILSAVIFVRVWQSTRAAAPAGSPAAQSSNAGSPSAAAAPAAGAAATPSKPLEIELTTVRPVWMRVVVDGQRQVEREIPAGRQLTFAADRTIALRVGDGGSVRVKVGGRDLGPLGRDGWPASRTLTPETVNRR